MQFLWIIPSVGYGIFLVATTGQWFGLVFGGLSLVSLLVAQIFKNRTMPVPKDQPVHFDGNRFAIGSRVLPRWETFWKSEWVEQVYQALAEKVLRNQASIRLAAKLQGSLAPLNSLSGQLTFWLGFDGTESIELAMDSSGGHAILVGPTGSGKSQLLTSMLVSACQGYPAKDLRLILLDFKGGSALAPFAKTPWCFGFATNLTDNAQELVAQARQEISARQLLLSANRVSRLQDLKPDLKPPILLLVVDELQAVLQLAGMPTDLEDIAARGRSLGVHLLVTAQSLNGVPRALLANLGLRIAIGKPDPIDLAQLGIARHAEPPGISKEPRDEWILAQYSTPKKTGSFLFPAGGVVSENLSKYLFFTESKTKDYSKALFDTDFVEKPMKNFDFSIGF